MLKGSLNRFHSYCRLKIYTQCESRELFYLVGMFRTLSPGDSISVARRKLLQWGGRGSKATYMFAAKGAGSLNTKIRYQVKELNILCMGKCKPLGSLNSSAPQLSGADPVSLFTWRSGRWLLPAFSQLLSNHRGKWQYLLHHSFGSPHSHLEARSHWWLWHFLFIVTAGDIFISHYKSV